MPMSDSALRNTFSFRSGFECSAHRTFFNQGFTLTEIFIVLAIISVVSLVALPMLGTHYENACIKATMAEITGMIREAKQLALAAEKYYAVGFDPTGGKVSLISGRGADNQWNTDDDPVVRTFFLSSKGGSVRFGYGACGPLPGLAAAVDGVTFQTNNTLVCNPDLTGNAGTVYLTSPRGAAMAIVMNSEDFGYKLWRWDGKKWVRQ